ncbi:ubiquinol oxidase subunit II [Novosphingobium sp. PC22D]|uniref:ubiquinol oxidase subunit II n=1 Tax=Novosphingobium sp. PC22D TaxID=1962403 RepID=UPI000BF01BD8|nr:ubiquinol oxidase subunit II [Novosphingobium sp. PC22D]
MLSFPRRFRSILRPAAALAALPAMAGCNKMVVLDAAGDVARRQGDLVMISTVLMLLIIVPVMALTIVFAWRYRAANKEARYEPDWDHSTQLELVIWAAPLLIIICLGALTWVGTHLLDPYRAIGRTAPGRPVAATEKPLDIQVVALDWKWLFIYPEQGIATVNELALPTNRPVRFRISASSVMNSFYVPALAGQIYAMPGMETKLHAVLNEPGRYEGFSANYSGAGFSHMRFAVNGLDDAGFAAWARDARQSRNTLDRLAYLRLEQPSENEPHRRFASVEPGLFDAVVNMCVEPGKMCMRDMMAIDARGGLGLAGIHNTRRLSYDKFAARGSNPAPRRGAVTALCEPEAGDGAGSGLAAPVDPSPLLGAGLSRPGERRPGTSDDARRVVAFDPAPPATGKP